MSSEISKTSKNGSGCPVMHGGMTKSSQTPTAEWWPKNLNLDIVGTMCIPPNDNNTDTYFSEMNKINQKFNFKELSMGMSKDYLNAIQNNATYVRIGSKIFGSRD